MAKTPIILKDSFLHHHLEECGLQRIHQGKVRDTYAMPGDDNHLLIVTTDRISIFDFVLPALVPGKGAVLTTLTSFWLTGPLGHLNHHLVAEGKKVLDWLPVGLNDPPSGTELVKQAVIVKKLNMIPVECIVRDYLTGSGLTAYKETGAICGRALPVGLHDGSKLPFPIFTPTTKSDDDHDVHMNAFTVEQMYGSGPEEVSLQLFNIASDYARQKGIIIADTKLEFGYEPGSGDLSIGDEVFTPDSSRFWSVDEWEAAVAQGKSPSGYDKEPVRDWGKTVPTPFGVTGIHKLSPKNPQHVEFVHSLSVPEHVIRATSERYRVIEGALI